MLLNYTVFSLMLIAMARGSGHESESRSRRKRYLIEPFNTQMGLFATLAVPLEYNKHVSVAYFIEGNYYTLQNASWVRPAFESTYIEGRGKRNLEEAEPFSIVTRRFAYIVMENNIERQGLPGRACLLRAICEHAEAPLHHNGVMGDFLYIVFTPSASLDEDLPDAFYEAEHNGKHGNCKRFTKICPTSIINSISFIHNSLK